MIDIRREQRPPPYQTAEPPQSGDYAELCVTTNFTFLTGASHPEELVTRAAELGLAAIAITDRNSLAGVVRAYSALKQLHHEADEVVRIRSQHRIDNCSRREIGAPKDMARPQAPKLPKLITGCRLVLRDSMVEWLALPTDLAAYQRLTRLLTMGKRRAGKGECLLDLQDMLDGCKGMILIGLPQGDLAASACDIRQVQRRFSQFVFLGAAPRYDGSDQAYLDVCAGLALRCAAPMVAVGDVLMHSASRRRLADVLTCMREGCTIDQIGTRALLNAERRLKGHADMARVFRNHPVALRRTVEIALRCNFRLCELSYKYPDEVTEQNEPPMDRLRRLAQEGLKRRYPAGPSERALGLMEKELAVVAELDFPA